MAVTRRKKRKAFNVKEETSSVLIVSSVRNLKGKHNLTVKMNFYFNLKALLYGGTRADSLTQSSAQDSVDYKQKYDRSLSQFVKDCLIPRQSHEVSVANN